MSDSQMCCSHDTGVFEAAIKIQARGCILLVNIFEININFETFLIPSWDETFLLLIQDTKSMEQ